MLLSESLVWALEEYEISGIKVFCDTNKAKDISNSFMKELNILWEQALEAAIEEYEDIEDADLPAYTYLTDYGFFISVSPLEIYYCYGDYYDGDLGYDAFNKAFKNMKTNYPDINYVGYIGYPVSDVRCGEAIQFDYSSKNNIDTYDFIGEKLGSILNEDSYDEDFEANLLEQLESYLDFKETIKVLYAYKKWIGEESLDKIFEVILEAAEENDEDIDELNEYIEALNMFTKTEEGDI